MMNALWMILILLTTGRLFLAATGLVSGPEAYLMLCAQRLDWGFVEGPAGVPALIRLSTMFAGWGPFGARLLAPLFLLFMSWALARLAEKLGGREVAFWSVLALNLLPLANMAALVMEGTIVVATLWMLTLAWSWSLLVQEKKELRAWIGFGLLLAITTQVGYAVGWLLPLTVLLLFVRRRGTLNYLGLGVALLLLSVSWVGPVWWNIHHDWLQWNSSNLFWAWPLNFSFQDSWCWLLLGALPLFFFGMFYLIFSLKKQERVEACYFLTLLVVPFLFCVGSIDHDSPAFGLQLLLMAAALPGIVSFFLKTDARKKMGGVLLGITAIFSLLMILEVIPSSVNNCYWSIPNRSGVRGVQKIAVELLRLRALETDATTPPSLPPFIIAETPELAALLGTMLPIHYPELSDAPSVFTPESPSFSSQFQLWPHYADAVATGVVDPLYTEEPKTSPFVGHNALYVTTESAEDLPETISGAFASVAPVGEMSLQRGKKTERLIIYECKNYQMLPL